MEYLPFDTIVDIAIDMIARDWEEVIKNYGNT